MKVLGGDLLRIFIVDVVFFHKNNKRQKNPESRNPQASRQWKSVVVRIRTRFLRGWWLFVRNVIAIN